MPRTSFIPSQHGFGFPNTFSNVFNVIKGHPELGQLSLGAGRCGGMAFAALDHYCNHPRLLIPTTPIRPRCYFAVLLN